MSTMNKIAIALALSFGSTAIFAAEVGIASFNLAWMGSKDDFKKHLEVCSAPQVNWCETRARTMRDAQSPTNEEVERAKQCQANFETAAGGPEKSMMVAPCNAYRLNSNNWQNAHEWYAQKVNGLAATIDKLVVDEGISIFAFQEVSNRAAIQDILGKHAADFESCVAEHNAFQTVGFAWKKSLSKKPVVCKNEDSLAIKEKTDDVKGIRRLRPGVELNLTIQGKTLSLLNVHLKSSCANLVNTERYPARLLTDNDAACKVLNRQIAPLENWIEAVAVKTPMFIVLGDFNRRIDEEAAANIPAKEVRLDGSDPASPNSTGPFGEVKSRVMWQEISDGTPSLVQIPLAEGSACKGFVGLDHILFSSALYAKQAQGFNSLKLPVIQDAGQKIISSDHCPRIVKMKM